MESDADFQPKPVKLAEQLKMQQQRKEYVDLELIFSCGTSCVVHKCVMAAMSGYAFLLILAKKVVNTITSGSTT